MCVKAGHALAGQVTKIWKKMRYKRVKSYKRTMRLQAKKMRLKHAGHERKGRSAQNVRGKRNEEFIRTAGCRGKKQIVRR